MQIPHIGPYPVTGSSTLLRHQRSHAMVIVWTWKSLFAYYLVSHKICISCDTSLAIDQMAGYVSIYIQLQTIYKYMAPPIILYIYI
jgi:hypothetical protein